MVLLGTIKMFIVPCYFCSILLLNISGVDGILYPRESESRQIQDLNGIWDFRMDDSTNRNKGFEEDWFKQPLKRTGSVLKMPVPSSFNDITETREMRDFVGWVWYDRQFYVSPDWIKKRVVLRVDSAHYTAVVWVNSIEVVKHTGGHLPFEREVSEHLNFSGANRVTIAINNTLTPETLPPGEIVWHTDSSSYPIGYFTQKTQTNAFNYAGLHRSVRLYTTPVDYVDDITITTSFYHSKGYVKYNISRNGNATNSALTVEILDNDGNTVARAQADEKDGGELDIENVNLWWPYLMVDGGGPAYLYTLKVSFNTSQSTDVYRLPFGVRTVEVNGSQLFINKKPFYCRGVAKQEDADLPSDAFTEEYQVQFMRKYHEIFDALRKQFLVGEMVWNFADFQTDQTTTRVDGNKKGVFTRQRQPKMAAHFLRDRYQGLINRRSGRTCRKSFNLSTYFQEL
ncbi:beta-glucuronidase [Lingula anatina]|uniref:Beta-glucuronidase n=1 Tax=Lingula anatina TaxID=7574 RepID=A0A1S3K9E6_LINAN|nr:beta-glucuronidase [Lingula anatina]|eukprot:XP_013419250.1 beta-glucuronidase [Lingula anatina]